MVLCVKRMLKAAFKWWCESGTCSAESDVYKWCYVGLKAVFKWWCVV